MNEKLQTIRNALFYMMILMFFISIASFRQMFDIWFVPFGLPGLAVVLLTFWIKEGWIPKLSFLLAGGAGAAMFITCVVFNILRWSGHTPGGDGGGITVPMILGCPIVFAFAAVSAIACLIKASMAKAKSKP